MLHATAEPIETRSSCILGLLDMYRDLPDATNQHYLEEQLSCLESRAGGIVSKICKAFEAGEKDVGLPVRIETSCANSSS
jgi:hypothetical protein